MKKNHLILGLVFHTLSQFTGMQAFSQTEQPVIQLELGVGKSEIRRSGPSAAYTPRTSGAAFIGYFHPVSRSIGISLNVGYEIKGSNWTGVTHLDPVSSTPNEERHIYNFRYLGSQAAIQYNFLKNRLFANVGGYYGYMLTSEFIFPAQLGLPETVKNIDFKNVDLGVLTSFGANFPVFNRIGVSTSIKATLGLRDISTIEHIIDGVNAHLVRNQSVTLHIGAFYKLQRGD